MSRLQRRAAVFLGIAAAASVTNLACLVLWSEPLLWAALLIVALLALSEGERAMDAAETEEHEA